MIMIIKDKKIEFEIGDKVKIRTLGWFLSNYTIGDDGYRYVGQFTYEMTLSCGKELVISNKIYNSISNQWLYKLYKNNRNEQFLYTWLDYMLDPEYIVVNLFKDINSDIINEDLLNVGDKIKIRSREWFIENSIYGKNRVNSIGLLTDEMINKYRDQEAVILNIVNLGNNKKIYKLDIDNKSYDWKDYMFDLEYLIENKINTFCKFRCVYECKKDKCPIYNIQK